MSDLLFTPATPNINTPGIALGGVPETVRQSHKGDVHDSDKLTLHYVLLIIIGAIIFVAVIAFYEAIKSSLFEQIANDELNDPRNLYTNSDIIQTSAANSARTKSNVVFAMITIIIMIIAVGAGMLYHKM